jgi:hypothetical protein
MPVPHKPEQESEPGPGPEPVAMTADAEMDHPDPTPPQTVQMLTDNRWDSDEDYDSRRRHVALGTMMRRLVDEGPRLDQPSKPKTSKKCVSKFPSILISNLTLTTRRCIRDNQYELPSHWDILLNAHELVQQIVKPNLQERPSFYNIVDHTFFTLSIVPGYLPPHRTNRPTSDISRPSPPNLSRLQQACQLDGKIAPTPAHDNEPLPHKLE